MAEHPAKHKVDPSKPLVPQVAALGPEYDEWTHLALPGVPRLFGPDWLEACSKTPWFVVPIIWIPFALTLLVLSKQLFHVSYTGMAWRILLGIATWHLLEYSLHRWAFHAVPTSNWGITFHFLMHGIHHKYPSDELRLVFPIVPAIVVALSFLIILKSFLPWAEALPVGAGIAFGYVAYDCTHYYVHHGSAKESLWFEGLRASHMEHHYRDHSRGYGISTAFFDWVFMSCNNVQSWAR